MCEKCTVGGEYTVIVTLNDQRREAFGKAVGLVKMMAQQNPDPRWKQLYNHLVPITNEIREQLHHYFTTVGREPPPFEPDREMT